MIKLLRNTSLSLAFALSAFYAQAQSISITASTSDTICSGTMVTFAATVSGVATPHYQWLKNSVAVGVDSNHYSTAGLSNGDVIMCELTSASSGGSILALSGPRVMTVYSMPTVAAITGASSVCHLGTTTLADATPGGVWSSSDPLIMSVSSTGVVTAPGTGADTISYTVSNMCGTAVSKFPMTTALPPIVVPITGPGTLCMGATATYTDTSAGGTGIWTSSTTSVATISSTGVLTPVALGIDTVLYSVTNTCGTTTRRRPVAVQSVPTVGPIGGPTSVCQNDTIHVSDPALGGTWRSTNNVVAGVMGGGPGGTVGVVRGFAGGTVTIVYTIANACGIDSAVRTITVNPLPLVYPIVGPRDSMCPGGAVYLTEYTTGGIWSSKDVTMATVDGSGTVTGVAAGIDTIFYSATNTCGTTTQAYPVYVYCPQYADVANVTPSANINIYPNPASTVINIEGTTPARVQLFNTYGQMVKNTANTNSISIGDLPSGIYYITVYGPDNLIIAKQSLFKQ